jgi:DNA polymerase-3 subunit epsilon
VILSIGAFAVVDDSLFISDSFEAILLQYKYLHDKLSNEFIIESKMNKLNRCYKIVN